jgi:hypothetical protein
MAPPIDPITAVGAGMPPSSALPTPAGSPSAAPAGQPLFEQSLQALHQAAQAPDAVGRGVRAEASHRTSAPMQLLNHLTNSVIAPAQADLPRPPALADGAALNESAIDGLQRVSSFAIQTSIQLASESTMLSVTSALASAANTTFHQLLSSNE